MAKVLLVEDEFHIASLLTDALAQVGYEIMGPVATAQHALRLLEEVIPRGAVLNFQLRDGDSTPVAEVLQAAGVWFVVISSYDDLPPVFDGAPREGKPVDTGRLVRLLHDNIGPPDGGA